MPTRSARLGGEIRTNALGKTQIIMRERAGVQRVRLQPGDDPQRIIQQLSDALRDATRAPRYNPMGVTYIAQAQALTNGTQALIRHTLGAPVKYIYCVGQAIGSPAFAYVRNALPANLSPNQAIAITPSVTGTYDIAMALG